MGMTDCDQCPQIQQITNLCSQQLHQRVVLPNVILFLLSAPVVVQGMPTGASVDTGFIVRPFRALHRMTTAVLNVSANLGGDVEKRLGMCG